MRTEARPWGRFDVLYQTDTQWLKRIHISPGQSLSLQVHKHRNEYWAVEQKGAEGIINGCTYVMSPDIVYHVKAGWTHRLYNPCNREVSVLEWALGRPDESDIERLVDDYGRA